MQTSEFTWLITLDDELLYLDRPDCLFRRTIWTWALRNNSEKTIGKSNFCRNLSRKVWKKSYSTLRAFSAFNLFQQNTCSSFDTTDAKAATLTYWQAFAFSLGEEQISIFACIQTVASLTRHDLLLVPHMMLIGSTIVFSHKHIAWSLEMQDLLVNWREQWHVSFFLELIDCWSYTSSTTPVLYQRKVNIFQFRTDCHITIAGWTCHINLLETVTVN